MKFIHLSDLHIGTRVNEFSMLDDQKYVLEQIIKEAETADAVLIAGDISWAMNASDALLDMQYFNNLKGKNGADLGKSVINSTLQNPVYVKSDKKVIEFLENNGYEVYGKPNGNGLLRYGKDNIAAIAKHKGVIEPDKWLEVQRLLKANSLKAPAIGTSKKALLSGLLTCKCGSKMQVRYGKPRKDGTRTYYYLCSMKVDSSGVMCNAKNIKGELLESKLIE